MMSFRKHLEEKLEDDRLRLLYEEERQLAELSLAILDTREHLRLSQREVARRAKITQQQVSNVENGVNCNIATFLRVCNALGIKIDLEQQRMSQPVGSQRTGETKMDHKIRRPIGVAR